MRILKYQTKSFLFAPHKHLPLLFWILMIFCVIGIFPMGSSVVILLPWLPGGKYRTKAELINNYSSHTRMPLIIWNQQLTTWVTTIYVYLSVSLLVSTQPIIVIPQIKEAQCSPWFHMTYTVVEGSKGSSYLNNDGISCDGHSWGTSRGKNVLCRKVQYVSLIFISFCLFKLLYIHLCYAYSVYVFDP